jgi:type IV pilus assembly protein PilE
MKQGGFTLVELMIVVAIIGLLAMIGYPSYEEYIRRANRTEAKNLMMRIAGEQEKFFSTFNRYSGDINGARTGDPATSGLNMPDTTQDIRGGVLDANDRAYYTVAVALTDANLGYTLTATPVGTQQSNDRCGAFVLDSRGNRTADEDGCW